ncbi:MAG: hypothetical protein JRJ66_04575 [Deltaproteobacteria bacterium]|nr:hypothetical protein [Deltaproteobacteria bacterium]MBW1920504.1 hypothetical protein [Deltaproteobacteria bacterium]MBW1934959.1 hypothetical protein [Deltaproteobacteria bacterium]
MHIYWRVKEELKYLGEILVFHDPGLQREYRRWLQKMGENIGASNHVAVSIREKRVLWSMAFCLN